MGSAEFSKRVDCIEKKFRYEKKIEGLQNG